MTIILTSIVSLLFITYIAPNLFPSSRFLAEGDFTAFVVTITYPILDMMLFVPSIIILISLRKDDVQSIPWILLSLSLLVNAVADERYVNDFVRPSAQSIVLGYILCDGFHNYDRCSILVL